jgi:hypothetical protein
MTVLNVSFAYTSDDTAADFGQCSPRIVDMAGVSAGDAE